MGEGTIFPGAVHLGGAGAKKIQSSRRDIEQNEFPATRITKIVLLYCGR